MPRQKAQIALCAALLALTATGCEHQARAITMTQPSPPPLRLSTPERGYQLPPADRARIVRGFDAPALERLLGMVRPDMRQEILAHFLIPDGTESRRHGQLVAFHDSDLQAVLEEVWAPMWDEVGATDEEIDRNVYGWPGREVARQRRAAAREHQSHHRS